MVRARTTAFADFAGENFRAARFAEPVDGRKV
jgi:hypothetical protein